MDIYKKCLVILSQFLFWSTLVNCADLPCAARHFEGRSVVCICNATYCDEISREPPTVDKYVAYTSSEGGLRFSKTTGKLQAIDATNAAKSNFLEIDPEIKYQKIEGFGGSVTDATGIQWTSLPEEQKQFFIDSYCSEKGIEYNLLRVPIAGTDFSTRVYTYNELPENDTTLSNFSLTIEDTEYKIPLIKACMAVSTSKLELVASTWSPPIWMKTNRKINGIGLLLPEYYQTFAEYHVKFIDKYKEAGVPIWAITMTNEPHDGLGDLVPFNDLGWTTETMGKWLVENLGPTMRSKYPDVKIIANDDLRSYISHYFDLVIQQHPDALQYIDGIGVHWYQDKFVSPDVLSAVARTYPDKFILATEACTATMPTDVPKVDLGSWKRAAEYIVDILEDLNYYVAGWIDWNMALNKHGGPNWSGNYVDSPVIVFPENGEFIKQPMFYAMGHFSKFIPRGSYRVKSQGGDSSLKHVAVLTPRGTVVAVLYNEYNATLLTVKIGNKQALLNLEANSITTVEFLHEHADDIKKETPVEKQSVI